MKILSLTISLLGILALLIMLNFSSPAYINNNEQLSKLEENSKVQTQGLVISERILYEDTKLLKLNNSLEILCQACPPYINRTLDIQGTKESYKNNSQIRALKLILQ